MEEDCSGDGSRASAPFGEVASSARRAYFSGIDFLFGLIFYFVDVIDLCGEEIASD